ncbi:phage tail tape measure protein [uncultured Ruminococcus sp.]|uniref:phage tail tape measure protein n=1 Tax=uncultured Ruminococcus sp. TaxID=165186 RepID=UPI0025D8244B|nr:phage tail tape measure protein [uncultured Ruminococcus sp.]
MASTIKGITVKIAGETTDLQKALKNIQSSSRSLQSELKTINNQLKFDPDNTVLLAQKQDVLREQIDNSTNALKELVDVEEQVKEQAKSGEISTDQFRAYQREVEKTKSQLENFKKQLADTEAAAKAVNMKQLENEMSDVRTETSKTTDSFKELEDKSNNTNLSKFKKEVDDVKTSATELKDVLADTTTGIGVAVGTIGGSAVAAITSANSEKKALNSLQAQTGLAKDELLKYKSVINDIYKDNFGESQEEIADTLAKIKQVTSETDPSKLKEMAENLYTLQDTFDGFDINETLRGINGLVTNMGLSAEDAFDLIVKGAQNGLNYSGELADNIAEYSQIWGQAGFSAEQTFSILENGTKNGAYNLDKVNDFVKEFTISLSDGRIEENIGSFSEDTATLFNKWKDGKATAADVFYSVIKDLKNAKTDQEALTTASNVWSSLGEDNALKVITSLGDVNDSYKDVEDSMQKVKDIKYDDVESDWENIGRVVQTDLIQPIGKELYPVAKEAIKWASEHLDDLETILESVAKQAALIWGAKKSQELVTGISNLIGVYKNLSTATDIAATAQKGLNAAQSLNIIGTITTLVIGLVSAVETYNELKWSNSEAGKFCEEIDKIKDNLAEYTQEITDNLQNTLDRVDELYSDNTLIDEYQAKLDELIGKATLTPEEQAQLTTIVTYFKDNVPGFNDAWAKYIEISDNGKVNLKGDLDEIRNNISKTIDDYKKLANQSAISELQSSNVKAKIEANKNRTEIKSEMEEKMSEIDAAYKKLNATIRLRGYDVEDFYNAYGTIGGNIRFSDETKMYDDIKKQIEAYNELKNQYNESTAEINKLTMTSDDLSDVQKVLNGDYTDAAAVLMAYNQQMISQNDILAATDENGNKLWSSMDKLQEAARESGKNTVLGLVEGTKEYQGALVENSQGWASTIISEYDKGMEIHSPSEAMRRRGVYTVQGLINGLMENNEMVRHAGTSMAKQARSGAKSVSLFNTGNNFVQGFINGISNGDAIKNIWDTACGIGGLALGAVKKILGINSPSKEAKKIGNYFTEGLAIGISGNKSKVRLSTESIARDMLGSFDFNETVGYINVLNDKFNNIKSLDHTASSTTNKVITNAPRVALNYYGNVNINNDLDIDDFNERVSHAVIDTLNQEC